MSRPFVLWLLCGLCACQRDIVVIVSVSNIPQRTASLQTMVTLAGKDAREVPGFPIAGDPKASNFSYTFGFRVPAGSSGALQVAAAALDPLGCLITTGITAKVDLGAVPDKVPLGLSDPPPDYQVSPCLSRFPAIGIVDQLPAVHGAKQRRLRLTGWGFAQGTSVSISPDAAGCTSAVSASNLVRLSPLEVEVDEPALDNPTGRKSICLTLTGPAGQGTRKIADLYKVTFARTVYSLGPTVHPDTLALGDLDGDGTLDLAVSAQQLTDTGMTAGGVIAVLLNQGKGVFPAAPASYPMTAPIRGIAIGDLNGDQHADIAVSNPAANPGSVMVLLNQGGGKFSAQGAISYNAGDMPDLIAIADLDGDGKKDLAVVNDPFSETVSFATVSVLLNNGTGFKAPVGSSIGPAIGFLAASDLDGDGKPDLAVPTLLITPADPRPIFTSGVSVLLNDGKGGFPQDVATNQKNIFATMGSAGAVIAKDVNGDGKPDLIVSGLAIGPTTNINSQISVLINKSTGTGSFPFAKEDDYQTGPGPFTMASEDLDGDGQPDLVVTNFATRSAGVLTLLLNQHTVGAGQDLFPRSGTLPTYPMGIDSSSVVVGDLDGDGRIDMAVANLGNIDPQDPKNNTPGTITVYLNTSP